MKLTITQTQIIRSIVCLPMFPGVVLVGILLDDVTGICEYYYPLFNKQR